MAESGPTSITVNEAIARLVNLDYVPNSVSLFEMLEAFLEVAEVELHNYDGSLEGSEYSALQMRHEIAQLRLRLAEELRSAINQELAEPTSKLKAEGERVSEVRLRPREVDFWAAMNYGISLPAFRTSNIIQKNQINQPALPQTSGSPAASWRAITIKIRANHRLSWAIAGVSQGSKTFQEMGLIDKRKNSPNHLAGLLTAFAAGRKFPRTSNPENKDKTKISKLRALLKMLTNVEDDPFTAFNVADGWKPRFTLIDDRGNAASRAKDKAVHVPYEDYETDDFEDEDDEGGKFIRGEGDE